MADFDEKQLALYVRISFWLVVVGWLLFVLFQRGHPFDEAEHTHVAWLIEELHQVPIRDFFQHHQPLLWDLLGLYYRFGGTGPEALYFGRGLVLLCGLLTLGGLSRLGTLWKRNRGSPMPTAVVGISFFTAATVIQKTLFVIRPETLSTAAFVWACVFWTVPPEGDEQGSPRLGARLLADFLAGLCFAIAAFSSPRYLLLGGVFLLLPSDPRALFTIDLRRLGTLGFGSLSFVTGYLAMADLTLRDIHFNLAFSGALQKIGDGNLTGLPANLAVAVLAALLFGVLFRVASSRSPGRWGLDLGYLLLVGLLSAISAGRYPYSQNISVGLILSAILLVRFESHLEWRRHPGLRASLGSALLLFFITLSSFQCHIHRAGGTVYGMVRLRNLILDLLRPGDAVLLTAWQHPITAADASYYAHPFADSVDRTCQAVAAMDPDWNMPECNYLQDLVRHRPAVVDFKLPNLLPEEQRQAALNFLIQHYSWRGTLFIRNDRLPESSPGKSKNP